MTSHSSGGCIPEAILGARTASDRDIDGKLVKDTRTPRLRLTASGGTFRGTLLCSEGLASRPIALLPLFGGFVSLGNSLLMGPLALRPCALDVVENSLDLRIVQDVSKSGHVAFVVISHERSSTLLHDLEEHLVGMVPRMAASVMRWRR